MRLIKSFLLVILALIRLTLQELRITTVQLRQAERNYLIRQARDLLCKCENVAFNYESQGDEHEAAPAREDLKKQIVDHLKKFDSLIRRSKLKPEEVLLPEHRLRKYRAIARGNYKSRTR